jgi:hypothetical protein
VNKRPLKSVKGNSNSISKENLSGTFPSLSPPLGGPPEATRSAGGDSLISWENGLLEK